VPRVAQGGRVTLHGHVGRSNGYPADAADLHLTLLTEAGTVVSGFPVAIPPIVRLGLGDYSYEWTVPGAFPLGDYTATWHATVDGADAGGSETVEVVEPGTIDPGPLIFLRDPEDYDGIRNLLGVTDLDVPATLIESVPFGPHAELLVMAAVEDWEDIPSADTRWTVLRLASSYATAALIAESAAKGGFLGFLRGEGSRSGADWTEISKTFWGYYERLLERGEEPTDAGWAFPWMIIAKPSSGHVGRPWAYMAHQMDEGGF
jgi:hypothetical protein